MSFLLDTDHVSAHLRRPSGLAHRFFQYSGRLYAPSIALAELYVWAYRRSDPTEALASIGRWVDEGAHWGKHWAYDTLQRPKLPAVRGSGWCRNPIDYFVLARLQTEGLAPSAEATREAMSETGQVVRERETT
jgi:hypothetical protein